MATQMRKGKLFEGSRMARCYHVPVLTLSTLALSSISHVYYYIPITFLPKVPDFLIHTLCVGFISKPIKTFTVDLLTSFYYNEVICRRPIRSNSFTLDKPIMDRSDSNKLHPQKYASASLLLVGTQCLYPKNALKYPICGSGPVAQKNECSIQTVPLTNLFSISCE